MKRIYNHKYNINNGNNSHSALCEHNIDNVDNPSHEVLCDNFKVMKMARLRIIGQ